EVGELAERRRDRLRRALDLVEEYPGIVRSGLPLDERVEVLREARDLRRDHAVEIAAPALGSGRGLVHVRKVAAARPRVARRPTGRVVSRRLPADTRAMQTKAWR